MLNGSLVIMACPRDVDGKDGLQIWRIATNILQHLTDVIKLVC